MYLYIYISFDSCIIMYVRFTCKIIQMLDISAYGGRLMKCSHRWSSTICSAVELMAKNRYASRNGIRKGWNRICRSIVQIDSILLCRHIWHTYLVRFVRDNTRILWLVTAQTKPPTQKVIIPLNLSETFFFVLLISPKVYCTLMFDFDGYYFYRSLFLVVRNIMYVCYLNIYYMYMSKYFISHDCRNMGC